MDEAFGGSINGPNDGAEKTLFKLADATPWKGLPGFWMARLTNELHKFIAKLEMI